MIFPLIYILLLAVTILQAYRKERKRKRKPVQHSAKVAPPQEEQPLPSCFTIEWDLENGGSKITVDE